MRSFAERLRGARAGAGYESAKQFADVLGVEPHTYRYWERGEAAPNLTTLTRICQLLNVEPNDLLPLARKRPRSTQKEGRNAA